MAIDAYEFGYKSASEMWREMMKQKRPVKKAEIAAEEHLKDFRSKKYGKLAEGTETTFRAGDTIEHEK